MEETTDETTDIEYLRDMAAILFAAADIVSSERHPAYRAGGEKDLVNRAYDCADALINARSRRMEWRRHG